jgi:uncharacterized protein (DUF58 family)
MGLTLYPTARAVFLMALGVPLALILGVAAPGLWLIGVAWLLFAGGVIALDALLAAAPSALVVSSRLPRTIPIGTTTDAVFALRFAHRAAPSHVEASLDTGPNLAVTPQRLRAAFTGNTAGAGFTIAPVRRGEGRFERIWLRWRSPLGLSWRQRVEILGRTVPVTPNVASIKEQALRLFSRDSTFGLHQFLNSGDSSEFHALRDFQPGMDRRRIDWKQSARHGALRAKEFHAEQNQHIVLALDTGRLMSDPVEGQPRIDRAVQASLLMAYVALKLGDRVGLYAFDEKPRVASGTVTGTAAFPLLQELAAKIDYAPGETNFTLGLTQLSGELERRSIIVIFTDFVDTTSAELMLENVGRLLKRHLVLFIVFRDQELESLRNAAPQTPEDVSRAVVADTLLHEREIVIERLRRMGVEIVDAPVDRIGPQLLSAYLETKRQSRL